MVEGQEQDLLWDHAGENLETDPLLEGHRTGYSTFYSLSCGGDGQLSRHQAEQILLNLEEAHSLIKGYLDAPWANGYAGRSLSSGWTRGQSSGVRSHCAGCCQKLQALVEKLTRQIIIITVVLQLLNIVVLTIIDFIPKSDKRTILCVGAAIMIILQAANLLLVIFASIKLARQMMHRSVSGILLAQGYFATLLLFAGVYTATFRLSRESWKFIEEDVTQDPVLLVVSYCKFLFFSVSTGTLCGSSNVLPKEWYNCLLVSLQMLLSYTYFASILGQAVLLKTLHHPMPPPPSPLPEHHRPVQVPRTRRGSSLSRHSLNESLTQSSRLEDSGS